MGIIVAQILFSENLVGSIERSQIWPKDRKICHLRKVWENCICSVLGKEGLGDILPPCFRSGDSKNVDFRVLDVSDSARQDSWSPCLDCVFGKNVQIRWSQRSLPIQYSIILVIIFPLKALTFRRYGLDGSLYISIHNPVECNTKEDTSRSLIISLLHPKHKAIFFLL